MSISQVESQKDSKYSETVDKTEESIFMNQTDDFTQAHETKCDIQQTKSVLHEII